MKHKTYFKIGQAVIANSFDHKKIIGEFRGRCNSFGVYVYGKPVDSSEPETLHKCISLTLSPAAKAQKVTERPTLQRGEPCSGMTSKQEKIVGFYIQCEGDSAWIRGWPEGISKFEVQQTYKVKRSSLSKPKINS